MIFCIKESPLSSANFDKEPDQKTDCLSEEEGKKEQRSINLSLILILLAIFFWFISINSIETYFTLYASNVLNLEAGDAMVTLAFFAVAFVASAVPAGIIGTRFGRKRTILTGLLGLFILLIFAYFLRNIWIIRACLTLAGLFWGLVNINSLQWLVELPKATGLENITGYYYLFFTGGFYRKPFTFWANPGFNSELLQSVCLFSCWYFLRNSLHDFC